MLGNRSIINLMKKATILIVSLLVLGGTLYATWNWKKSGMHTFPQEVSSHDLEGVQNSETSFPQSSGSTNASNPTAPAPVQQDNCSLLANNHYQSTEQLEGGMGPNGSTKSYWEVDFSGNKVTYQHSDVVESGTYTCSLGKLKAVFSGNTISASYDRKNGVLTWDGNEYIKATTQPIFCGGIVGLGCPTGYSCHLEGSHPDAGGTCVKE
jgi:hypothetical protein